MKTLIGAIALLIAAPVAAQNAPSPAPASKADCCEKMKSEGKECCCKGMDHSKHDTKAKPGAPGSSGEQGHEGHAH